MRFEDLSLCEHRSRFVLIDLYQQQDAVRKYTSGWSKEAIVEWLRLFGEVKSLNNWMPKLFMVDLSAYSPDYYYVFVSPMLIHTYLWSKFHFDEAETLTVYPLSHW